MSISFTMRSASAILACAFLALQAPGAFASDPAFVNTFGGKSVVLLRGDEKVQVRVQTLLASGDRLSAGEGSFVEVKYLADGCTIRVSGGNSMVVAPASPCASSAAAKSDARPAAAANDLATTQTAASAATVVAAQASANTAEVTGQSGPLTRANFGQGLVDLPPGTILNVGDTVFAGQGSSITLYFPAAGCEYVVQPESYLEIKATAPCQAAANTPESGSTQGGMSPEAGVAAGVVVLGGGAAAVLLLAGGDSNPATPD